MKKIIPIIAIVLLSMMSCHRQKNNAEKVDIIETGDDINWSDSIVVVYRNGCGDRHLSYGNRYPQALTP